MYIIEDETHTLILDGRGRELVNRLSAVHRPDGIDILSNGFKPRNSSAAFNQNTLGYAAFAANPSGGHGGTFGGGVTPATAR